MKKIQVFDPPMCCSTGACGPTIDPDVVNFAVTLGRLDRQGVTVDRYNLSQHPKAFLHNLLVKALLDLNGATALPIVVVDGVVNLSGHYPTKDECQTLVRDALGATAELATS